MTVRDLEFVTGEEAAALVGVEQATIWKWVQRGHLRPAGKSGRRNLYHVLDVLAAEKRTREANPGRAVRRA